MVGGRCPRQPGGVVLVSGGHSHPPQRFALCLAGSGWGGQGACTGIDDDRLGLDHQVDGLLGNLGDGLGRLRRLVLVNRRLDRARLVVRAAEVLLGVLGGELAGGDGHAEAFKLAVGVVLGVAVLARRHVVEPAGRCSRPARLEAVHLGRQDGDDVDELRELGRLSLGREGVGAAVGRVAGLVEALDLRLELGEELVEVLLPVRVARLLAHEAGNEGGLVRLQGLNGGVHLDGVGVLVVGVLELGAERQVALDELDHVRMRPTLGARVHVLVAVVVELVGARGH